MSAVSSSFRERSNLPRGHLRFVQFLPSPPAFARNQPKRRARLKAGIVYEQKCQEAFRLRYPTYVSSPWISFEDDEGRKFCQPDGLLVLDEPRTLIITEMKYQHCYEAYEQLYRLYLPVLGEAFPGYRLVCLEVCKWYDPAVQVPVTIRLCEDPLRAKAEVMNVHLWKPGQA